MTEEQSKLRDESPSDLSDYVWLLADAMMEARDAK